MKTSRLALGANPCGATHPCASASTRPAQTGRSLSHLAAVLCLALIGQTADAASVNLEWNPNPETNIAGYKLSYGTSPRNYSSSLSTGAVTNAALSGLIEGQTYYFVVQAVNTTGLESALSAEISHQVPVTGTTPDPVTIIPSAGWQVVSVSSQETSGEDGEAINAIDDNPATFWHSKWVSPVAPPPHEIRIDLGSTQSIQGFRYLPRQDIYLNGTIAQYEFYVSLDGVEWGLPAAAGTFAANKSLKEARFTSRNARFIRLRALSDASGGGFGCVAELDVLAGDSPTTPPNETMNQLPVAASQAVSAIEDQAIAITLGASDADQDPLAFSIIGGPSIGVLSGTAPNLTYTPDADSHGSDSFTFRVNDGTADSNTATVSIQIASTNDAPAAAAQQVSTTEDKAVGMVLSASDRDGDSLSFRIVSGPTMGSLSGTAPNLTYTPAADANGPDSFTFTVNDGKVDSTIAKVSINISPTNDAPVAAAQSGSTSEDKAVGIILSASDKDGDALSYRIITGPSKGSLSGTAPNLTYTPSANANGTDSFSFRANDGTADSNTASVSINIGTVNDTPVAASQVIAATAGTPVGIVLSASDADGDLLTYGIVAGPAQGSLSGSAPNLTYTPNPEASGADSISFRVNDGKVNSNTATVSINITAAPKTDNKAPVFQADLITRDSGKTNETYIAASLAGSAVDPDADAVTYSKAAGPEWLVVSPDGKISGTPPAGAEGLNSFTIRAADTDGAADEAVLEITILPTELPLPWSLGRIGTVSEQATAWGDASALKIKSPGILAGSADSGIFTWQTLSGDGEITARISTLENANNSSRIGLVIRESLAPNSKHVFIGTDGSGTLRFIRRNKNGGSTTLSTVGSGMTPNLWLRLVRTGTTTTAFSSTDGASWKKLARTTISPGNSSYVGMMVCGGDSDLSTGVFQNMSVTP